MIKVYIFIKNLLFYHKMSPADFLIAILRFSICFYLLYRCFEILKRSAGKWLPQKR